MSGGNTVQTVQNKCATLIRARKVKKEVYGREREVWERLKEPEPCGVDCMLYEVRKALKRPDPEKAKEKRLFTLVDVALPEGPSALQQPFCDKHKRKAEREGMKLTPVQQ